jgi:hypothetical protein
MGRTVVEAMTDGPAMPCVAENPHEKPASGLDNPGKNRLANATPIYRAVMLEIERRRLQLGWPMWRLDDEAGTQDGYYSKALYADGKSGRQARYETVEQWLAALFPAGYDTAIHARNGLCMSELEQRRKIRLTASSYDRKSQRDLMSELGRKGGTAPRRKLPGWKRRAIARKAARTRHRMARARAEARKD